jgi:hypothetical protein
LQMRVKETEYLIGFSFYYVVSVLFGEVEHQLDRVVLLLTRVLQIKVVLIGPFKSICLE